MGQIRYSQGKNPTSSKKRKEKKSYLLGQQLSSLHNQNSVKEPEASSQLLLYRGSYPHKILSAKIYLNSSGWHILGQENVQSYHFTISKSLKKHILHLFSPYHSSELRQKFLPSRASLSSTAVV